MPDAPTLSIHRSFVVRLYAGSGAGARACAGRVEHVVSGAATEFLCVADLLEFFQRVLDPGPPDPPRRLE